MKKLLFSIGLCMFVTLSIAQKKAVREAKSSMDSKNFTEARILIAPALTNPETATDPETWKTLGDIENTVFEQERNNEMLKKDFNQGVMYTALMDLYEPYIKADSLGQIPNEKGKVKNKFRKDILSKMLANHSYFYNGGVYYNEQKDYSKASKFFGKYWELPSLTMFNDDSNNKINTNDSTFQIIKYYTVVCAIQAEEHPRAIELLKKIISEPFIANSAYKDSDVYEFLASEYQTVGDSVLFVETLEEGANKFPSNKYFLPNLINEYIKQGDSDKAIAYLDKAIASSSSENLCDYVSTKAGLYSNNKDFDNAYKIYQEALAKDPNCEKALEGLGVAYLTKALDLREQAGSVSSNKDRLALDNEAKVLYEKALPLLEKFKKMLIERNADNSDLYSIEYKLQNVYYNLNMNKEFEQSSADLEKYSI